MLCGTVSADVIRLKNGNRIVADSARESNGRVEYTVGENTFAIPKSLVEGIDAGPVANVPAPAVAAEDLPRANRTLTVSGDVSRRVVHDGQIDVAALRAIEKEGDPERSAMANFEAARLEHLRHHPAEAAGYLQAALEFTPDQPELLESYATVLVEMDKISQARPVAEHAVRTDPRSSDALNLVAYVLYKTEHSREAIEAWKKSLALRDDPRIAEILARVERETRTEAGFHRQESSHFVLRFEGSDSSQSLREAILSVLEDQYNTLVRDMGVAPLKSISVSLYTGQAFFDVTQAPAWTAALNDGKIRIPVSGLTAMTPSLQRVLRHELTHSFIDQIARGRAPQWLHEGVAQLEEPASTATVGGRLALLYASGNQVPLSQLEDSFMNLSRNEAAVVYAEALAAVECIKVRHGMADLTRILQRLGEGQSVETALRGTIHGGYANLEAELADYLKRAYGQ